MPTFRTSVSSLLASFRVGVAAALTGLLLAALPTTAQAAPPRVTNHLMAHLPLRKLQTVNLGMGRPTGFLLRAHNVGGRCVELFEQTATGETVSLGLLGPGATVTLKLAPGSGAFVQAIAKRAGLRAPFLSRSVFEFEVINGTDDALQAQFVHQVASR